MSHWDHLPSLIPGTTTHQNQAIVKLLILLRPGNRHPTSMCDTIPLRKKEVQLVIEYTEEEFTELLVFLMNENYINDTYDLDATHYWITAPETTFIDLDQWLARVKE